MVVRSSETAPGMLVGDDFIGFNSVIPKVLFWIQGAFDFSNAGGEFWIRVGGADLEKKNAIFSPRNWTKEEVNCKKEACQVPNHASISDKGVKKLKGMLIQF